MMYEVLKAVAVRDGPANTAQDFKVGELAPGDVVEALELGTTVRALHFPLSHSFSHTNLKSPCAEQKDGSMRIRVDCQDGSECPVAGWSTIKLVCSFDWVQSDILLWCRMGEPEYPARRCPPSSIEGGQFSLTPSR